MQIYFSVVHNHSVSAGVADFISVLGCGCRAIVICNNMGDSIDNIFDIEHNTVVQGREGQEGVREGDDWVEHKKVEGDDEDEMIVLLWFEK